MVDPATLTIMGWFLSPVISFVVNKALEYLSKPSKRASACDAELNKLKEVLNRIKPLVAYVDQIKVEHHQHQNIRRKLMKTVLQAERDTLNFNREYKQILELEEEAAAEAKGATAGKISVIKRWKVSLSVTFGLPRYLSKSITGWQRVERIANDFIRESDLQSTTAHEGREVMTIQNTDDIDSERQDNTPTHKRKRDTDVDLTNKKMKINDIKGKERAENGEGINPIYRERMDSQIVEFGRTPLEMWQYAKGFFDKSCPSFLREEFAQCQSEDIEARMAQVVFEVGVAAATLWQRCQELDLVFKGKVLPPQIEKKDLEDDKNNKSEEGSSKD